MINSLPSKFEKNILGVMPDTREKEIIADIAEKKNMLMLMTKKNTIVINKILKSI